MPSYQNTLPAPGSTKLEKKYQSYAKALEQPHQFYAPYGNAQAPNYLEDPSMVGKYQQMVDQDPKWNPEFISKPALKQAYDYYEYINAGKPWQEWKSLNASDPARAYLKTIENPVNPSTPRNTGGALGGQANPYTDPNQLYEHDQLLYGMMSPDVKSAFSRDATTGERIGTGVGAFAQVGMAGLGAFAMGSLAGAGIGILSTLATGGAAAPLIPVMAQVGGWSAALIAGGGTAVTLVNGEPIPWLQDTLDFFNIGQYALEAGVGTVKEMQTGKSMEEIWSDPALAWEGFKQTTWETMGDNVINAIEPTLAKMYSEPSQTAGEGEVYKYSLGQSDPSKAVMQSGSAAEFGADATEMWRQRLQQIMETGVPLKEASLQLRGEIFDVYRETGVSNDFVKGILLDPSNLIPGLGNVVGRKVGGALGNETMAIAFKRATPNLSTVAIDLLPMGLQQIASKLTGIQGSIGPLETFGLYKTMIQDGYVGPKFKGMPDDMKAKIAEIKSQTGSAPELSLVDKQTLTWKTVVDGKEVTNTWKGSEPVKIQMVEPQSMDQMTKVMAGIDSPDAAGNDYGLSALRPASKLPITNPIGKFVANLVTLTPDSQFAILLDNMYRNMPEVLKMAGGNWTQFEKLLKVVAGESGMPADLSPETMAFLTSPSMRAIREAVRSSLAKGDMKNYLEGYNASAQSRKALFGISRILNQKPGEFLEKWAVMTKEERRALFAQSEIAAVVKDQAAVVMSQLDMFTDKKNPTIWSQEELQASIFGALAGSLSDYAKDVLGVKPNSTILELANLMKGVQSLVLLGFNPMYLLNNAKNNLVTRLAEGVGGFMTPDQIAKSWERIGFVPFRLREGFGPADTMTDLYGHIMGNLKASRGIITKASRIVGKANQFGVFSNLSRRLESMESAQAMTIGYNKYWHRTWRVGDAISKMDPVLERALGKDRAEMIYKAVESGYNMDQIRAEVYGATIVPQTKAVMTKVIDQFTGGAELGEALKDFMYLEILPELDAKLKGVKTTDDVDDVMVWYEANIQEKIHQAINDSLITNAEATKNIIDKKAEGTKAVFGIWGSIAIDTAKNWVTWRRWVADIYNKRASGVYTYGQWLHEFETINKKIAYAQAESRRFQSTLYAGVIKSIGVENEFSQRFINAFDDTTKLWEDFFKLRDEEHEMFKATSEQKADESFDDYKKRVDTDYKDMEKRLNDAYDEAYLKEKEINKQMSIAFAGIYAGETGWDPIRAQVWRDVVEGYRQKLYESQKKIREATSDKNLKQKNEMYAKFNAEYNQMIADMQNAEKFGSAWMMNEPDAKMTYKQATKSLETFIEKAKEPGGVPDIDGFKPGPEDAVGGKMEQYSVEVAGVFRKATNDSSVTHYINSYNEYLRTLPDFKEDMLLKGPEDFGKIGPTEADAWRKYYDAKHASDPEKPVRALKAKLNAKEILKIANDVEREAFIERMGGVSRKTAKLIFQKQFNLSDYDLELGFIMLDAHADRFAQRFWGVAPSKSNKAKDAYWAITMANILSDNADPLTNAINLNIAYNYTGKPVFKGGPEPLLFQDGSTRSGYAEDLAVFHNMDSEENFARFLLAKVIPGPSMAVVRSEDGWHEYGAITLIGNRPMIDPEISPEKYISTGDSWSPMHPSTELRITNPKAIFDIFANAIDKYAYLFTTEERSKVLFDTRETIGGATTRTSLTYDLNNPATRKALIAMSLDWLDQKGKSIDPKEFVSNPQRFFSQEVIDWYKTNEETILFASRLMDSRTLGRLAGEVWALMNTDGPNPASGTPNAYYVNLHRGLTREMVNGVGLVLEMKAQFDGMSTGYDFGLIENAILAKLKESRWTLTDVAKEVIAKGATEEFFTTKKGKEVPYTPENVLDEMKQYPAMGAYFSWSEEVMRAKIVRPISSIEDMHKRAHLIKTVPEDAIRQFKAEVSDNYDLLIHDLGIKPEHLVQIMKAYSDKVNSGTSWTGLNGYVESLLRRVAPLASYVGKKQIDTFLTLYEQFHTWPTEYFEAKVLDRVVNLGEFSGAIVPDNLRAETMKLLNESGLEYRVYKNGDKADRQAKVAEFYDIPGVVFDKSGSIKKASFQINEDGLAVVKGLEKADVTSFYHEVAHIFRRDLTIEELDVVAKSGGLKDATEFLKLESDVRAGKLNVGDADYKRWVAAEENFARGWERYLAEGYAPTPQLKQVFKRFTEWALKIYDKLTNKSGKMAGWQAQHEFAPTGRTVDIATRINGKSLRDIFDNLLTEAPRNLDDILADGSGKPENLLREILGEYGSKEEAVAAAVAGVEPWELSPEFKGASVDDASILDAVERADKYKYDYAKNKKKVAKPAPAKVVDSPEMVASKYAAGTPVDIDAAKSIDLTHEEVLVQSWGRTANWIADNIDVEFKKALGFDKTVREDKYIRLQLQYMYDGKVKPSSSGVGAVNAAKIDDFLKQYEGHVAAFKKSENQGVPLKGSLNVDEPGLVVVATKVRKVNGVSIFAGVWKDGVEIAMVPGPKVVDNVDAPEGWKVLGLNKKNPKEWLFQDPDGNIRPIDPDKPGAADAELFQMADVEPASPMKKITDNIMSGAPDVSLEQARSLGALIIARAVSLKMGPNEYVRKYLGGINEDPYTTLMEGAMTASIPRERQYNPREMMLSTARRSLDSKAEAEGLTVQEYMLKNKWAYGTEDTEDYLRQSITALHSKGALRANQKTVLSIDISAECPMADTMPCMYCYALGDVVDKYNIIKSGRKPPQSPNDLYGFRNLSEDVFGDLTPESVAILNDMGGIRVFSTGDFVAKRYVPDFDIKTGEKVDPVALGWKEGTYKYNPELILVKTDKSGNPMKINGGFEIDMMPYYDMMKVKAKEKGLKLKFITKVMDSGNGQGTVDYFGDYDGASFNLSSDFRYVEQAIIPVIAERVEGLVQKALRKQKVPRSELEQRTQEVMNGTVDDIRTLLDPEYKPVDGGKQKQKLKDALGFIVDYPSTYARGWKPEHAEEAKAKLPAGRVANRYVAMNRLDAYASWMDPSFDVVTLYHGVVGDNMYARIMHPLFAGTNKQIGDTVAWLISKTFEANIPQTMEALKNVVYNDSPSFDKNAYKAKVDKIQADLDKYYPEKGWKAKDVIREAGRKTCCLTGSCASCTVKCGVGVTSEINAKFMHSLFDNTKTPVIADISRGVEGAISQFRYWLNFNKNQKDANFNDLLISLYPFFEPDLSATEKVNVKMAMAELYSKKKSGVTKEAALKWIQDPKNLPAFYQDLGEMLSKWITGAYTDKGGVKGMPVVFKDLFRKYKAWIKYLTFSVETGYAVPDAVKSEFARMFGAEDPEFTAKFREEMAKYDKEIGYEPVLPKKPEPGVLYDETNPAPEPVQPGIGDSPLDSTPVTEPIGPAKGELNSEYVTPLLRDFGDEFKSQMLNNRQLKFENEVTPEMKAGVDNYMGQVENNMNVARLNSTRYAENVRDLSLLDYRQRYGIDNYLMLASPYEFWYTRSMTNWAKRMIDKPRWFSFIAKLRRMQETEAVSGYPSRLGGKTRIPLPWLPDWAGGGVYSNPWDQLVPWSQFDNPFEQQMSNKKKVSSQAVSILDAMLKEGKLSQADYDKAVQEKDSDIWKKAVTQAQAELDLSADPASLMSQMFQPPLWYTYGKNALQGTPEKNSVLPITRTGQAVREMGKDTAVQPFTDVVGGLLAGPEEYIRKKSGLSEFGEWGDYNISKAVTDIVGDGKYTYEEGLTAMIEKSGPIWEEAKARVSYENALRTPGAALALGAKGGGGNVPTTLLATLFPGGLFPAGELKMRGLKAEYDKAWKDYNAGDKDAIDKFTDKHPEYRARLALFDEPEERMRQFLINQIYTKYFDLPKAQQNRASDALGGYFKQTFFDKGTRSPQNVELEQLVSWAKTLGAMVPKTPETVGVEGPAPDYLPQDTSSKMQKYYDARSQLFPDWSQMQQAYSALPRGPERRKFVQAYPRIKAMWDWNDKFKLANPDLVPFMEEVSVDAKMEELQNAIDPSLARQLYDYGQRGIALSPGAMAELQRLWKTYGMVDEKGKSIESFADFIQRLDMMN